MHEYSLVQSLMSRVAEEAHARGAIGVRRLTVRIGALAGVDPGLFATAYDTWREGTLCAEATLTVEPVEAVWVCPRCDRIIAPGAALRCPTCGIPAQLGAGDEIVLDRIELEVP